MAYRAIRTINAHVARSWFQAEGQGIVWAVLSTGVDGTHPHFKRHANLELPPPLKHRDFIVDGEDEQPLVDAFGHGTGCAGLIAGEMSAADGPMIGLEQVVDEFGKESNHKTSFEAIPSVAPKAKILSLKVLDVHGSGKVSKCIQALSYVEALNDYGRRIVVHGVNMSLGYEYDPRLYACGQSPLCIAINRLVQSGVVVVASAGNGGYVQFAGQSGRMESRGFDLSIIDPGNAELAITVGSTHRDQPARYGVSYFSSKGPTLDGRPKPDLVAPGEYVMQAAPKNSPSTQTAVQSGDPENAAYYLEKSGVSLSTALVSGAAAALLSVRRELIGQPLEVKSVLMSTAVNLGRPSHFQGAGLVDVLRAIFPTAASLPQLTQASGVPGALLSTSNIPAIIPAQPAPPKTPRLMISYSHKDETHKEMLVTHLTALERGRMLTVWQDRKILPGMEFGPEIAKQLEESDIIVLLISADFLASDYCFSIEMKRAIERHKEGKARVIPVVVRSVDWSETPMWGLNPLPKDGKPVSKWPDTDEAWLNVAQGIRAAVQEMTS